MDKISTDIIRIAEKGAKLIQYNNIAAMVVTTPPICPLRIKTLKLNTLAMQFKMPNFITSIPKKLHQMIEEWST